MTSLPSDRLTADCFVSSLCHSSWKTYRDLIFHQLLSFLHTMHFSHPHIKYNSLLAPFLARIMTLSRPHWHAVGRQSADSRPTGDRQSSSAPTVGRPSADCRWENIGRQSTDCRPTVDRQSTDSRSIVGRQSVDSRPTVGRLSVDSRSIVDRLSTDCRSMGRSTVGRLSADSRSTVGRLSTDCRPTGG